MLRVQLGGVLAPCTRERRVAEALAQRGIVGETRRCGCERRRIARRHEQRIDFVTEHTAHRAKARGNDRRAHREALSDDHREALEPLARHDDGQRRPSQPVALGAVEVAAELDARIGTRTCTQLFRQRSLAQDDEASARRIRMKPGRDQRREPLLRRMPPHKEKEVSVAGGLGGHRVDGIGLDHDAIARDPLGDQGVGGKLGQCEVHRHVTSPRAKKLVDAKHERDAGRPGAATAVAAEEDAGDLGRLPATARTDRAVAEELRVEAAVPVVVDGEDDRYTLGTRGTEDGWRELREIIVHMEHGDLLIADESPHVAIRCEIPDCPERRRDAVSEGVYLRVMPDERPDLNANPAQLRYLGLKDAVFTTAPPIQVVDDADAHGLGVHVGARARWSTPAVPAAREVLPDDVSA